MQVRTPSHSSLLPPARPTPLAPSARLALSHCAYPSGHVSSALNQDAWGGEHRLRSAVEGAAARGTGALEQRGGSGIIRIGIGIVRECIVAVAQAGTWTRWPYLEAGIAVRVVLGNFLACSGPFCDVSNEATTRTEDQEEADHEEKE